MPLNQLVETLFRNDRIISAIFYANIGMFILSIMLNPFMTSITLNPFTFLSPEYQSLILLGATGTIPIDRLSRWWTLISANYLHGGILHIFFNMMALKQIAPLIIAEFGTSRMIIIYTLSGVAGFWVSYLAKIPLTIGASASLCGLMGAALYYGKSRGGTYGTIVFRQISSWAIGLFIFGFLIPGINNWGHGGGIIAGAVCAIMFGYKEKSKQNWFHHMIAGLLVLLTVCVLIWAAGSGIYLRLR